MSRYDVSIDPGLMATGVCIWLDGKVVATTTIHPKGETFMEKAGDLYIQIKDFVDLTCKGGVVGRWVVEQFEGYNIAVDRRLKTEAKSNKVSMAKAGRIAGWLLGIGLRYTPYVEEQSKGGIKKAETALLAKAYGVTGSKDALDAFQIGVCAGLDRKGQN